MPELDQIAEQPPAERSGVDPALAKRRPRAVSGGMWGVAEIVTVSVAAAALLLSLLLYLMVVVPSNRELQRNRAEADRLESEAITARSRYGEITSTQDQVSKLLVSADDFETRFLPAAANGRSALYQRINGLIAAYGLTNTTGPDYQPLETIDQAQKNQSETERGRERFRSLFPGVYITMTLEGSYQNLRRFIREVETGNEFIAISSVELAPSENSEKSKDNSQDGRSAAGPQGEIPAAKGGVMIDPTTGFPVAVQPQSGSSAPARQQGKTRGEVVALRLEMAAYFRRPNFTPMAPAATGQ